MIIYSVTIGIDPAAEPDWLDWMQKVHIRDVLRTGCFLRCRILKVLDQPSQPSYLLQYDCRSLQEYERYRINFAPTLQKEHTDRYAGCFRAARQLLEEIEEVISA